MPPTIPTAPSIRPKLTDCARTIFKRVPREPAIVLARKLLCIRLKREVVVSFGVEPFSQPGHSREGGNPVRRETASRWFTAWIPAFAGMTVLGRDEVWQMTPVPKGKPIVDNRDNLYRYCRLQLR